jgi:hypothetical protein
MRHESQRLAPIGYKLATKADAEISYDFGRRNLGRRLLLIF